MERNTACGDRTDAACALLGVENVLETPSTLNGKLRMVLAGAGNNPYSVANCTCAPTNNTAHISSNSTASRTVDQSVAVCVAV